MNNIIFGAEKPNINTKVVGNDDSIENVAAEETDWIFVSKFKPNFTTDNLQISLKN